MKYNSALSIVGDKIILVPYRRNHVKKYHEWMESAALREQTSSERLSLEEEYAMQQTWLNDENKCTFIVLDKRKMDITHDEVESMIGDVNIYLSTPEDYGEKHAEIGLMIADPSYRGQGLGFETCLHIIRYGIEELNIKNFMAYISENNEKSLKLFNKLKFIEGKRSIFKEVTFTRTVDEEWLSFIFENILSYKTEPTVPNY